ncbi:MAG: glutaredoxin 3 [Solirubrobacterales bacterium]
MAEVEIYSTKICPYCVRAKRLLDKKGVAYTEIDVTNDAALRDFMVQRAGGRQTVPQIFINGEHVGGCDDLYSLEAAGELDPMLAGSPA